MVLGIEYENNSGNPHSVSVEKSLAELLESDSDEIEVASAVTTLAQLIGGSLDCESVLASSLINDPNNNDIHALYRQNIEQFCAQEPPYRFFRY